MLFLLFHILSFSPLLATSTPASTTIERSEQGISFLVIGDWGSGDNPTYAPTQAAVAQAMAQVGLKEKIQFVVSVGDNFYEDGVQSTTDPKWATSFVNMYTGEALQKRWYQMLGNHDYMGNVDAQLKYKADPRWHMPGRNYTFSLPVTGDIRATFIVIDTTPFVNEYYNYPQNEEMRNQLRDQHWEAQLEWAKAEFKKVPKKDWLIVFGHHPVFSGHKVDGQNEFLGGHRELQTTIQPLLEQHEAAAYISGHVHDLEHVMFNKVQYFVSGAGSRVKLLPRSQESALLESYFHHDGAGFMSLFLGKDNMTATFYDETGAQLYSAHSKRKERVLPVLDFHLLMQWNGSLLLLLFVLGTVNVIALGVLLVIYLRRRQRRRSQMIPMQPLGGAHYEIGDDGDDPEAHQIGIEEEASTNGSYDHHDDSDDEDKKKADDAEKEKEAAVEQPTQASGV
jgi:tartrate-resistant acid phosphatase type 5